jgi:hypothetical protein
MSAYAWQFESFIVSSIKDRHARIYDVGGRVLDTSGMFRPWAFARVPIGQRLFEIDFHVNKFRQIERKYGPRVEVRWIHESDRATLASLDPELTVEDLIAEYELTPLCDYRIRAKAYHDQARARLLGNQAETEQDS